ncbi:substrate-binding periplasmic protein [Piscirickettsia litoralis]|uniref:ABC transporter substrate-binding protein n=1 Tax=Piscirickettsia litoralis TaxID=1891921 RepID=A0ABX2ZY40_9GAMM|nr:transporter substrate-binding domain-containing protein [Piscirickettsia litoralis]ODN41536.1 ABC transporter substrate-binding protein [Piscirickettsia litoralis]
MKLFKQLAIMLGIVSLTSTSSFAIQKVKIMTENYPPYNYPGEDKKPEGFAVDLLKKVLKTINAPQSESDIKVLPWPRAYSFVQKPGEKNMLFSMTRTEEREALFKWVGPITKTKIAVFATKDSQVSISNASELKQYKFAVVRGGISSILLGSSGVPSSNIKAVNKFDLIPRMIDRKRADLFVYEQNSAVDTMKRAGMDPSKYKSIFVLKEGELYYAFNLSVNEETIKAYQDGLDKVKQDSEFMNKITDQFLK